MTRSTPLGVVTIEEEVPTQGVVDVVRRVRVALDLAESELGRSAEAVPGRAARPTIEHDRTADAGPLPAVQAAGEPAKGAR